MDDYLNIDDERLMDLLQKGDHQAFSTLVRRHSTMFYASAYRVTGDQGEAEDAVQDAFLKLWKKPEVWNAGRGAKFTTWFYRVVINAATDRMRKKKPAQASDFLLENREDNRDLQDDALEKGQEEQALEDAIQALPERQKLALNLCFYEGMSNKEAAEILGVGLKALESLLMRAKVALRESLTAQGFIEKERKYG